MEKQKPKSYCEYVSWPKTPVCHKSYHDTEYGFPVTDDNLLFQRLVLEINQAGLNWTTILNKKENFIEAYSQFDIDKVANYSEQDVKRLLSNAGIIRNKLKVKAAIYNAQQLKAIQKTHGSFKAWLDQHHPLTLENWVKIFKKTFKFTGGEITNEFLTSCGYLKGAHTENCPVHNQILQLNPKWKDH